MNLQCAAIFDPIKVIVINPLLPASKLILVKILSGKVFGDNHLVDITLTVYANEIKLAGLLRAELIQCALICTNSINVSSDLPSVSDGDIFCFMTSFTNPNCFNFDNNDCEEQFDSLYLLTKLANSFSWSNFNQPDENTHRYNKRKSEKNIVKIKKKPIFMADGLVTIDILNSLSNDMPSDVFYCPTPLPSIAKSVLGDYLNVQCNFINDVLVWAANDRVFHMEFEKPLIVYDKNEAETKLCDWEIISKDLLKSLNLDHMQFNASWLRKDFIAKVAAMALENAYGCIYKAAAFTKSLKDVWVSRSAGEGVKVYSNLGVISDGSLDTIKGCAYVLPVVFRYDTWQVNNNFQEDTHLKQEIKRINQDVKNHHRKLIPYCKKFFKENVINQEFVVTEDNESIN